MSQLHAINAYSSPNAIILIWRGKLMVRRQFWDDRMKTLKDLGAKSQENTGQKKKKSKSILEEN